MSYNINVGKGPRPGDDPDAIYKMQKIVKAMPLGHKSVEMEKVMDGFASASFDNSNSGRRSWHHLWSVEDPQDNAIGSQKC